MCLLIAFYKVFPDYPIVIGANREESYSRPSSPPALISDTPKVWAGKDEIAGGTWLGVNEYGLVTGITNRGTMGFNPSLRSRGLLCLNMAQQKTASSIEQQLEKTISQEPYNSFNLFFANKESAYMAIYDYELLIHQLNPGTHVLVSRGLDGMNRSKIQRVSLLLESLPKEYGELFVSELMTLLRDHETEPPTKDTICAHGDTAGTVSSTILAIHNNFPENSLYLYSEGPSCHNSYKDFTGILSG